jgi:hypothetical protein
LVGPAQSFGVGEACGSKAEGFLTASPDRRLKLATFLNVKLPSARWHAQPAADTRPDVISIDEYLSANRAPS